MSKAPINRFGLKIFVNKQICIPVSVFNRLINSQSIVGGVYKIRILYTPPTIDWLLISRLKTLTGMQICLLTKIFNPKRLIGALLNYMTISHIFYQNW